MLDLWNSDCSIVLDGTTACYTTTTLLQ
uniref:Uncharacterized protein n=1 Tax=Arundo donax TaxID=35708 RepID=A0A0A9C731_ARUDO